MALDGIDCPNTSQPFGLEAQQFTTRLAKNKNVSIQVYRRQQNNMLAQRNRGWFEAKNILVLNLVSSPGSGKTTVLERTITALKDEIPLTVIEGDQQTLNDADRIAATGAPVIQVNTGKGCHLDAQMIRRACDELAPDEGSLMMIENVGNLVCPAMFDLETGECLNTFAGQGGPMANRGKEVALLPDGDLLLGGKALYSADANVVNPAMFFIQAPGA